MKKLNYLFIILFLSTILLSCSKPMGINGNVKDKNNQAVEGADISFNGNIKATTDANGFFEILDLPEGAYLVAAEKSGYDKKTQSVTVVKNKITNIIFSISKLSLKVDNPQSGTIWNIGTQQEIKWTTNLSGTVKIDLYKSGVLTSTIENSTENDGSYFWTLPSSLSIANDYKIKIYANDDLSIYDESDVFSINQLAVVATTKPAFPISQTEATLNATVNANANSCTAMFEYGVTSSYGNTINAVPNSITGTSETMVSAKLVGLSVNATYHYRIVTTSANGIIMGNDMSFTTNSYPKPTVTTSAATNVNINSATINGIVNANDFATTVTFEYGTSTSYGQTLNATPNNVSGSSNTEVSANLTSLILNTTYHYRLVATSNYGTSYGNDITFVTALPLPTATTNNATNVSYTTATINGSVNANGNSTTITFEYGTTTSYGSTKAAIPATATGSTNTTVSADLTGLSENTTYHFRIKAVSSTGTNYSNDLTFLTLTSPIPTAGLVAYYPFNGNANDESGNGNNGTVNGATLTTDRKGVANKAYSFDGVNDYIEIGDYFDNTSTLVFSFWFKPNNISSMPTLTKYSSNIDGAIYHIFSENNDLFFGLCTRDDKNLFVCSSNNCIKINEWQYIVCEFDLSQTQIINRLKFYHNGTLQSTTYVVAANNRIYNDNVSFIENSITPFRIGRATYGGGTSGYTDGLIDDIRIYNRILTESEIQQLYNE